MRESLKQTAKTIVSYIVRDIKNRKGIGNEWEMIRDDIQRGIEDVWINIIVEEIEKSKE